MLSGRLAAPAKLLIVDLIAEHDVEANKKCAGERDFRFGPSASMPDREVAAMQIVVCAGGERGGLAQHPAEEGIALLGDLAESLFVGRGADSGSQADVTHDVLAIRESLDGPEDEDRGESRQWTDSRMREQEPSVRVGVGDGSDPIVELVNPSGQPSEQLEAVIAAARGVPGTGQSLQLGETTLTPQRRAQSQALVEGDRLRSVFDHRPHPDQTHAVRDKRAQLAEPSSSARPFS